MDLQDWKVPQSWFAHFYDIGVVVNLTLAVSAIKLHVFPQVCFYTRHDEIHNSLWHKRAMNETKQNRY